MNEHNNPNINNTFTEELPGDSDDGNLPRQVYKACYSLVKPKQAVSPSLIIVSKEMKQELGLKNTDSKDFLNLVSGNKLLPNSKPYAMCYGGHQFGHWAGQLGDGRAINLGQILTDNKSWTLQLKGSGTTPYSRSADGLAVLRSSIREFLCSEAMFHLGVPTTRALSLALSGEKVIRDMLYDGNPEFEKGAIVARASESFIRFGSFEILSARQDYKTLKKLLDFTIKHHYSNLGKPSKETYLSFFQEVVDRTAALMVHWQRVGFVHGVMNTDNMSILGETIDYGPYGWLENYEPNWTPNTTDIHQKRYRFGKQASIALWNLTQLANALYPLIEDVPALEGILDNYRKNYMESTKTMHLAKLGFIKKSNEKVALNDQLLQLLEETEIDMTIFYRTLSSIDLREPLNHLEIVRKAAYCSSEVWHSKRKDWEKFLKNYSELSLKENRDPIERVSKMNGINPKYVLTNYMAQLAIDKANKEDYTLIHELHQLLKKPYDEQPEKEKWFAKRPDWAKNKVGCSQLSCSS